MNDKKQNQSHYEPLDQCTEEDIRLKDFPFWIREGNIHEKKHKNTKKQSGENPAVLGV